jgi:hypothetical protein
MTTRLGRNWKHWLRAGNKNEADLSFEAEARSLKPAYLFSLLGSKCNTREYPGRFTGTL